MLAFDLWEKGSVNDGKFTLRLYNILKGNGGERSIYAMPVVKLGNEVLVGQQHTTMKAAVEQVNALLKENPNTLTQEQIEAIGDMLKDFPEQVSGWATDAILNRLAAN